MTVTIRRVDDEAGLAAALALREAVFIGEQGVTVEAERDGHDDQALHLLAVDGSGAAVGTCRVLPGADGTGRFGRLAVAAGARGRGVGSALLAEAERTARAAGLTRLRLHAQTAARGLYDRAGYTAHGQPFDEEGIQHVTMEKPLA